MIPATKMISKVLWDFNIDVNDIEIGYYDRVIHNNLFLKFTRLWIDPKNKFSFKITVDNKQVDIPYHRLRVIKNKGKIIWQRK